MRNATPLLLLHASLLHATVITLSNGPEKKRGTKGAQTATDGTTKGLPIARVPRPRLRRRSRTARDVHDDRRKIIGGYTSDAHVPAKIPPQNFLPAEQAANLARARRCAHHLAPNQARLPLPQHSPPSVLSHASPLAPTTPSYPSKTPHSPTNPHPPSTKLPPPENSSPSGKSLPRPSLPLLARHTRAPRDSPLGLGL